jgi:hypothetical protein
VADAAPWRPVRTGSARLPQSATSHPATSHPGSMFPGDSQSRRLRIAREIRRQPGQSSRRLAWHRTPPAIRHPDTHDHRQPPAASRNESPAPLSPPQRLHDHDQRSIPSIRRQRNDPEPGGGPDNVGGAQAEQEAGAGTFRSRGYGRQFQVLLDGVLSACGFIMWSTANCMYRRITVWTAGASAGGWRRPRWRLRGAQQPG